MDSTISRRVDAVRERIERACRRAGRPAGAVRLIAVTKNVGVDAVVQAIEAGVTDIGENRIQEARDKVPALPHEVTRHLIGSLQTNKARFVGDLFDWVHSIDRLKVAHELGRRLTAKDREIDALIQVNVAGEASKHGVPTARAVELVADVATVPGIRVRGLMTIAPLDADERLLRQVFGGLRDLAEEIRSARIAGVAMEHLSMGMSGDFEIAVEEGATMVRVGSAIFGARA